MIIADINKLVCQGYLLAQEPIPPVIKLIGKIGHLELRV